jgi:hypothetical protein
MTGGRRAPPGPELPDTALATARRIWRSAAGSAPRPADVAWAAGRICAGLRIGLTRWIGAVGYRVLLDRTLSEVLPAHPVLARLPCSPGGPSSARAAVGKDGPGVVTDGVVALMVVMIDLLGRIMGPEMALRLVEQSGVPSVAAAGRRPHLEGPDE